MEFPYATATFHRFDPRFPQSIELPYIVFRLQLAGSPDEAEALGLKMPAYVGNQILSASVMKPCCRPPAWKKAAKVLVEQISHTLEHAMRRDGAEATPTMIELLTEQFSLALDVAVEEFKKKPWTFEIEDLLASRAQA